jgi:hypothetical protein
MVMMIAITPSLNASSLLLPIQPPGLLKEASISPRPLRPPEDQQQDRALLLGRITSLRDADPHLLSG